MIIPDAGNPVCLHQTIDSYRPHVDEFIVGDMSLWDYEHQPGIEYVKLPFNILFKQGFSAVLNRLASCAKNDIVLYMGVGNVLEGKFKRLRPGFNCWGFRRSEDNLLCHMLWDRRELESSGIIHEELVPKAGFQRRFCDEEHFSFGDIPKENPAYPQIKELLYNHLQVTLQRNPDMLGATNKYWLKHPNRSDMVDYLLNNKLKEAYEDGDEDRAKRILQNF